MITGAQCRAARALVEYSRERLATASGVDIGTIESFENKLGKPDDPSIAALQSTLETAGAVFLPDGEHGGIGVRAAGSTASPLPGGKGDVRIVF